MQHAEPDAPVTAGVRAKPREAVEGLETATAGAKRRCHSTPAPRNILHTRSGISPGTTKKPLLIVLEAMHSLTPILPCPDHTSRVDAEHP